MCDDKDIIQSDGHPERGLPAPMQGRPGTPAAPTCSAAAAPSMRGCSWRMNSSSPPRAA